MKQCLLCLQDRELRNSHIVPEFLYSAFYNDKGHMMAISGRGRKGWKPLQKGLRERMFCEGCEQHFNEHYEKPFHAQWCLAAPLPNPWNEPDLCWVQMDYASFKLFHLMVLFRAGVSTLPTYSEVSLGPHQQQLRSMLRDRDPGPPWRYPIIGQAVVHHKTNKIVDIITRPEKVRNRNGQHGYRMVYAGVEWTILVSSHRSPEFERVALQGDGRMPLCSVLWNEVSAIQDASRALRKGNPQQARLRAACSTPAAGEHAA